MDYSSYHEFPFPSKISGAEESLKKFFLSQSAERQLALLNGCKSYVEFCEKLKNAVQ